MRLLKGLLVAAAGTIACRHSPTGEGFTPVPPGPVLQQVQAVLARDSTRFVGIRRDLHRNPELSGAEQRTAGIVATEMRRLGLEVRSGVGGHGVVATLRGARPGPVVAYRADMDAVRSTDPDPVEFPSVVAGIRHICGHDIHTTVGIAVATALRQVRDSLAGSVLFVFQPAEETATGANAMLGDGVFAQHQPDAIFGLHTAPIEVGRMATTPGPMMAGRDRFDVTLTGGGDLAAAASAVEARILSLGTIGVGQIMVPQPPDFVLVQVTGRSITGTQARVQGTVTVASAASRARVRTAIMEELAGAVPAGVSVVPSYQERWIAGVTNDTARTEHAAQAARTTLGASNVLRIVTVPPAFSEDFGSFQSRVPGVFFYLGVSNAQRGWVGQPHSPGYVADERAIQVGAAAMTSVILDALAR